MLTAPAFFGQLQTNSADVPLAMAIALGVAALAAWIRTGARGLLPAATLFLTAGAMTKNEGELFALCAFLAALAATPRVRLRPLLYAGGAWVALIVPWHLWLLAHDVTGSGWKLSHLLHPGYLADNAHRVSSAAGQLLDQIWLASSWSRLPWLVVAGVAGRARAAALPRRLVRRGVAAALVRRPAARLLGLAVHAGEQPLQLGRPHDRHARDRWRLARAGAAGHEREEAEAAPPEDGAAPRSVATGS